jgi:hypothetical protein
MTRQAVPSTNVPICASAGARTPLAASVGGSSRRCLPGLSSTTSAYSPHMPHTMDTRKANQAAANHATSPSMSLAIVIVTARIAALKVSSCRVTSIANSNAFSVRASTCGGGSPRAERILSAKQLTIREADRCWRRVRPPAQEKRVARGACVAFECPQARRIRQPSRRRARGRLCHRRLVQPAFGRKASPNPNAANGTSLTAKVAKADIGLAMIKPKPSPPA